MQQWETRVRPTRHCALRRYRPDQIVRAVQKFIWRSAANLADASPNSPTPAERQPVSLKCLAVRLALASCHKKLTLSFAALENPRTVLYGNLTEQGEPQLQACLLLQVTEPLFGEREKAYMITKWNQVRQMMSAFDLFASCMLAHCNWPLQLSEVMVPPSSVIICRE